MAEKQGWSGSGVYREEDDASRKPPDLEKSLRAFEVAVQTKNRSSRARNRAMSGEPGQYKPAKIA